MNIIVMGYRWIRLICRRKTLITVTNKTSEKIFVLRETNDFKEKRSVGIDSGDMKNILFKSFKTGIILRTKTKEIAVIKRPAFQVVISDSKLSDAYKIEFF